MYIFFSCHLADLTNFSIAGGECFEERSERIVFGVDTMSACYFSWNATVSCSDLRYDFLFHILLN